MGLFFEKSDGIVAQPNCIKWNRTRRKVAFTFTRVTTIEITAHFLRSVIQPALCINCREIAFAAFVIEVITVTVASFTCFHAT